MLSAGDGRHCEEGGMRTVLICLSGALVIGLCGGAEATVRRVPSQYSTIQAGINAAVNGDTVLVANGTYTGTGNRDINFFGKKILVTSENGPEVTIIKCEGTPQGNHRGFYFSGGEDSTSVLRGFTIRDGYVASPSQYGGGIFCAGASPTIRGNHLISNYGPHGGGICCAESEARIEGNTIRGNSSWTGGGIACIDGSVITIVGNTITENQAYSDLGQGGGIYCEWSSSVIEGNLIAGNSCNGEGGGIYCYSYGPTIEGNTITGNTAEWYGGGVVGYNSWGTVSNCILWANSAPTGPQIFTGGSDTLTVRYCDVQGGWIGTGNINANPLFVTGPFGDYYLEQIGAAQRQQSPCVDAGDPSSPVPEATTRRDGRPDVWRVDMGYHYPWDRPPNLVDQPDTTITETQYLTFTLVATDPDTDFVTFSSPNLTAGATLNANSGVFQWTPTYAQAGVYPTTFIATDNSAYAQADTEQTLITVADLNRPPNLIDQPDTTVLENQHLTFTLVATDPDTDLITYSSPNLPAGATLNSNSGVFHWTPTYGQAGLHTVRFIATDNGSPALADTEQTNITVTDVNRPPNLLDQADTTVAENQYLTFTLVATDPDTDLVTFSSPNLPAGATLNSNSGVFQWTPGYGQAGNYLTTFIATDNGSPALADTEQTLITVGDVNRPPDLTDQPDTTIAENQYLTFTLEAEDPDGDSIVFSSPHLPEGATLDEVTGIFEWTPNYGQSGNHIAVFIATDNGSPALADTEWTRIIVGDVNRPPDLSDQPDTTVTENEGLAFTLVAEDPDEDSISFSSPDLPEGAVLDAESGLFEWTPTYAQAGLYTVTFIATDNGSPALADTEQTDITVTDVVGVSEGEEEPEMPLSRYLAQNCPNPFGAATTIRYGLVGPAHVRVEIYDIRGAFVRMLVNERLPAGHHRAAWDGRDDRGHRVASGVYFCRLETGEFRETRRMVLLR
jgi:hypothetical protein